MISKEQAEKIVARLEEIYPDAVCALDYAGEPWKLMIMGRLSAQCTDKRVNEVCKELFARCPTPEAVAACEIRELEELVRPCGLYRVKAKNIKDECAMLVGEFGGKLPDSMEELLRLPGVGRKIANLLLGDVYKQPAVVADTHCIRICGRLGFYDESLKDPEKVERIVASVVAPEKQSDFCHRLVNFGRDVCTARSPKCDGCPLASLCRHGMSAGF